MLTFWAEKGHSFPFTHLLPLDTRFAPRAYPFLVNLQDGFEGSVRSFDFVKGIGEAYRLLQEVLHFLAGDVFG